MDSVNNIRGNSWHTLSSEESRYWNGELEGEEFEKALNKYGYEYTPTSYENIPSRF